MSRRPWPRSASTAPTRGPAPSRTGLRRAAATLPGWAHSGRGGARAAGRGSRRVAAPPRQQRGGLSFVGCSPGRSDARALGAALGGGEGKTGWVVCVSGTACLRAARRLIRLGGVSWRLRACRQITTRALTAVEAGAGGGRKQGTWRGPRREGRVRRRRQLICGPPGALPRLPQSACGAAGGCWRWTGASPPPHTSPPPSPAQQRRRLRRKRAGKAGRGTYCGGCLPPEGLSLSSLRPFLPPSVRPFPSPSPPPSPSLPLPLPLSLFPSPSFSLPLLSLSLSGA